MERILCAAIRRSKPRECHNPYHEGSNDILEIEIGYRHVDIIYRFGSEIDTKYQGFYTSKGRYVNRKEAFEIAKAAGQLLDESSTEQKTLYSEDIY